MMDQDPYRQCLVAVTRLCDQVSTIIETAQPLIDNYLDGRLRQLDRQVKNSPSRPDCDDLMEEKPKPPPTMKECVDTLRPGPTGAVFDPLFDPMRDEHRYSDDLANALRSITPSIFLHNCDLNLAVCKRIREIADVLISRADNSQQDKSPFNRPDPGESI